MSEQDSFLTKLNSAMDDDVEFMRMGTQKKVTAGLSSGSFLLNYRLSGNPLVGYAYGRIVEIFGPEQSGKTTLALHAIAEAHKLDAENKGGRSKIRPAYIDAEHALDPVYAQSIGVDMNRLYLLQPDHGEQALKALETCIDKGVKLIVVDSVAALTPKAEIDGEMGDSHMGLHARLMSQAMRKLVSKVGKQKAIIIFINQIRMKIGVMFGNPETTTGGKALKFYASYRLDVRSPRKGAKTGKFSLSDVGKTEEAEVGTKSVVKVVKNKSYPPFKKAILPIVYGIGIDKQEDLLNYMETVGMLEKGVYLPSINKKYKKAGLKKVLHVVDVQQDLLEIFKKGL